MPDLLLAAMALTDGDVRIEMRGAGMFGGSATYEAARIRRPRDEAWIAAAGPAVTLVVAVVLWTAWLGSGADDVFTLIGAGAVTAFTAPDDERAAAALRRRTRRTGRCSWSCSPWSP